MNHNGWRCFLNLCKAAPDDKSLSELFNLLLTSEEKNSIENRCLIIRALLDQKKTQRDISAELNVSIAKITRGSNELKRISLKLKAYLTDVLL